MKKSILFLLVIFSSALVFGQNQEEKKVKKIKVEVIDENGETKVYEHEMDMEAMQQVMRETEVQLEKAMMAMRTKNGDWEFPEFEFSEAFKTVAFLGVKFGSDNEKGVLIDGITEDSGAEKAGLQKGDIIVSVGGKKIATPEDLSAEIKSRNPGDEIEIGFLRDGKTQETIAVLASKNTFEWNENMPDVEWEIVEDDNRAFLGIEPASEVKNVDGVMILKTVNGSAAEKFGLQTGDVITKIDGQEIKDFEALKLALETKKPGESIDIEYQRMGKKQKGSVELTAMKNVYGSHKKVIIKRSGDGDETEEIIIKE